MRVSRRTMIWAAALVLGIAGLVVGVIVLASPREPSYQGKTLSEWIAPFCRQTAKGLDAPGGTRHFEELQPTRRAVREIGTNAVPFLIARLNRRESGLHRRTRELLEKQAYVSLRFTDPNVSKIRAIRALANLGRDARPAIPSLAAQLTDPALSQHAVYALSGMGAEGMRALVEQYTNIPAPLRTQAAEVIVVPSSYRGGESFDSRTPFQRWAIEGFYVPPFETTNEIVAAVVIDGFSEVAKDSASPFLQMLAIVRLGECGPQASNAVPMLMQILGKHDSRTLSSAIGALGQIKSQPDVVVPALNILLGDPNPQIQTAAANALHAFGYHVYNIPVKSQGTRIIRPVAPGRTNEFRSL